MIETIRQGLKNDGYAVSISQLCRWFGIPRRTVYYKPTKKSPTVQPRFAQPIKQLIEEHPSFGYRTVAHPLRFNKNTVLSRSRKSRTAEAALEQALIALRHAGTRAGAVPASLGQRPGLHQPKLYGAGARLWASTGVHYAALAGAERHGRASDPHAEGPVRASSSFRNATARK